MKKYIVSPSLLACKDMLKEVSEIENIQDLWLHFDVMDGKFVPNTSFSVSELDVLNKNTSLFLDVHLMIENPKNYVLDYVNAGADLITFHYEACDDLDELIDYIHSLNVKVGVSLKPKTDPSVLDKYLHKLDLVLVMSVEPGFGGQSFLESTVSKISYLRKKIDELKLDTLIEVDGGINDVTSSLCKKAGVDVLVAGSYLFGKKDIINRIEGLKK